jgi:transcriptional regulator with XRE-family HTH domain
VPEHASVLFDEYAAAYARGERPRAEAYLERAGGEAETLAGLIDEFLRSAPAPATTNEDLELLEGFLAGDTPLLRLRVARGETRERVVEALVERLGLDRLKLAKVRRYYHRLEAGTLDPSRVDRRVLEALAEALRARVEDLTVWRPRPPSFELPAAYRAEVAPPAPPLAPAEPAAGEQDEIDLLFLGPADR